MEAKSEAVKKEISKVMNTKFVITVLTLVIMTGLCIKFWNADGSYQVELAADRNEGYQWSYALSDEKLIREQQKYYASGLFVFVFEGVKEGTAEVDFVLTKEGDPSQVYERQIYKLRVNPDKRIVLRGIVKS